MLRGRCVKRLLAAGAPVDQANSNGATPLWVACQGGFAACAEHLLAAGARVRVFGKLPLAVIVGGSVGTATMDVAMALG